MFDNGRKTIGVFLNRAELAFQQEFSKYLIAAAQERDYNVAFMTSYGVREKNTAYDVSESDIVDFAPIEKFAATVVALDTYDTPLFRNKLIAALKKRAKGPVVSFREQSKDFYSVISNANREVDTIIEHLVQAHGAKRICFMAGYIGHYDSNVRLEKYYEAMAKWNLPICENSVFYGDMWTRKGEEAYEFFFSDPINVPDAVICANDFMARSLCEALNKHGKYVPEDVIICGFDNAPEAREHSPQLTTVGLDYELMAKETIKLIDDVIDGVERECVVDVPAEVLYRESCGCHLEREVNYVDAVRYKTANEVLDQHMEQLYFSIDMHSSKSMNDIKQSIKQGLDLLGDYDDFYLCCFNNNHDGQGIESLAGEISATMEIGFKNGKMLDRCIQFEQKKLLPEMVSDDSLKVYYFRVLHNRERSFGYTAISYKNRVECLNAFYHDWNLTISLALNDYYVRRQMEELIAINKENSLKDYMTKVSNRLGLDDYLERKWEDWLAENRYVAFLSADLDGLKKINDTYGHKEGDWVICQLAKVLQLSLENSGIVARTGGDEFLIVIYGDEEDIAEELIANIKKRLQRLNDTSCKPYAIDCSIGSYVVKLKDDISLQECILNSDMEMYKIKKKKGSNRND